MRRPPDGDPPLDEEEPTDDPTDIAHPAAGDRPRPVEYGEWRSGLRSEGATYAIFSFTRKITQCLGGAATAWALALGGYVSASAASANPVQPPSALEAIKVVFGLVPAGAAAPAMLVFLAYPLTDQRFREIRDESEARKSTTVATD